MIKSLMNIIKMPKILLGNQIILRNFNNPLKKVVYKKGCHRMTKLSSHNSSKKSQKQTVKNYKIRVNKAMLKRVRIVGPKWDRKFKFLSTGKRHFLRNKSKNNLKRKKRTRYICKADYKRVCRMIPLFKKQRFKYRH